MLPGLQVVRYSYQSLSLDLCPECALEGLQDYKLINDLGFGPTHR